MLAFGAVIVLLMVSSIAFFIIRSSSMTRPLPVRSFVNGINDVHAAAADACNHAPYPMNASIVQKDLASTPDSKWRQIGASINGEEGDNSGYSVSLNAAGNIMVVGAPNHGDTKGQTRVYAWTGDKWTNVASFDGDVVGDYAGTNVALTRSGCTMAVSSPCELPSKPTMRPTTQPSSRPSGQPSSAPSGHPSGQPSCAPSGQPTKQPSSRPTMQPSSQPTQPSSQPSSQPTRQPSCQPTCQPTLQPSRQPTTQPSRQPSCQPTTQPSRQPTAQPSSGPSRRPSGQLSRVPSSQPTRQPSQKPSGQPSVSPSGQPSSRPSIVPSSCPTGQPSSHPTLAPRISCKESPFIRVFAMDDNHTQWIQIGINVEGEISALNEDGNIMAVGMQSKFNFAGEVVVYSLGQNNRWRQLGQRFAGLQSYEYLGTSVALNSNGSRLAFGAPNQNNGGGIVRVYEWNGQSWIQLGGDILGNGYLGYTVALNDAGSIVAAGSITANNDQGEVQVLSFDGTKWVGQILSPLCTDVNLGMHIAFGASGTVLATGSYTTSSPRRGQLRMHTWNGTHWQGMEQFDSELDGKGYSFALRADGALLAFGLPGYDAGSSMIDAGKTEVYAKPSTSVPVFQQCQAFSYEPTSMPSLQPSQQPTPANVTSSQPVGKPTLRPTPLQTSEPTRQPSHADGNFDGNSNAKVDRFFMLQSGGSFWFDLIFITTIIAFFSGVVYGIVSTVFYRPELADSMPPIEGEGPYADGNVIDHGLDLANLYDESGALEELNVEEWMSI